MDDHTVEIISKKAGKTMFTEVDTVFPDGGTFTQVVKDTRISPYMEQMCEKAKDVKYNADG